jgi:pRiA4b ORF-3-like protein
MTKSYTIYTLHAQIRDIEPPVWRRIHVDGNITLRKLHHILQAAFGWTDSHLHDFEIDGRTYAMGDNDNMLDLFAEDPEYGITAGRGYAGLHTRDTGSSIDTTLAMIGIMTFRWKK